MREAGKTVGPAGLQRSFERSVKSDDDEVVASARELLAYLPRHLGFDDLAGLDVLDVGCGVKFTRVILEDELAIGRYVGVDIDPAVIEALRENVDDPRFSFYLAPFYNERYNPDGVEMTGNAKLPIPDDPFDIICLFSVFTHLAPADYRAMLQVLRPYVKPSGRCFYTLYIDELTAGGHGLIDQYTRTLGDGVAGQTVDFRDFNEGDPLRNALYTEAYARELIEGTGWRVVDLSPPIEYAQHHFTLAPV